MNCGHYEIGGRWLRADGTKMVGNETIYQYFARLEQRVITTGEACEEQAMADVRQEFNLNFDLLSNGRLDYDYAALLAKREAYQATLTPEQQQEINAECEGRKAEYVAGRKAEILERRRPLTPVLDHIISHHSPRRPDRITEANARREREDAEIIARNLAEAQQRAEKLAQEEQLARSAQRNAEVTDFVRQRGEWEAQIGRKLHRNEVKALSLMKAADRQAFVDSLTPKIAEAPVIEPTESELKAAQEILRAANDPLAENLQFVRVVAASPGLLAGAKAKATPVEGIGREIVAEWFAPVQVPVQRFEYQEVVR